MKRIACIFLLLASPVIADVTSPSGRTIDCFCTDKSGARVELGQTICLQVDGRMFMAQCQMSLNVPMWRETQEGCFSSSIDRLHQLPQSRSVDAKISPSKS
jgi:hypothetical protein